MYTDKNNDKNKQNKRTQVVVYRDARCTSEPSSKNKKKLTLKEFLIFFPKRTFSYILGNGTF